MWPQWLRVRFPSIAPRLVRRVAHASVCKTGDDRFNSCTSLQSRKFLRGSQVARRLILVQKTAGSTPAPSAKRWGITPSASQNAPESIVSRGLGGTRLYAG